MDIFQESTVSPGTGSIVVEVVKEGIMQTSHPTESPTDNEQKEYPPLSKEEAENLLSQHEVIRDPIHQDIWITTLERAIIDSPAFQRLRRLSQLGPTQLVYPGASHSRLTHSIGTLHCAEQLVQIVNHNYEVYSQPSLIRIDPYPHLLIRICALLHDVAHIPFGHTLENEGNLTKGEWSDPSRAELWLGNDPYWSITNRMRQFLIDWGISDSKADQVVKDVRRYILPGDSERHPDFPMSDYPMDLDCPFVVDLVGNTLCADLLDYLARDMYFCGLPERSGDRVVKYLAVVRGTRRQGGLAAEEEFQASDNPAIGKGRVVLLAYRFEREHFAGGNLKLVPKSEILSEAIDLLRRRFALAEKVYFHRTKTSASAMLISALGSASMKLNDNNTYIMSDSDFISKLRVDNSERTKHLIEAYEARRLYKPVYKLNYREPREDDPGLLKLWRVMYPKYRDSKWRKDREQELETIAELPRGSIAIYCPDNNMNLKQFEMLVQSHPTGEIKYLKNILDPSRKREMDAINERFAQLWKLQVFVDPDALDVSLVSSDPVCDFSALCESFIEFPNDIPELQGQGRHLQDQIADRVITEWEQAGKGAVPHHVYNELVKASYKGSGSELIEAFRNRLKALMETE